MDLDLLSFQSLRGSLYRLECGDGMMELQIGMAAAQAGASSAKPYDSLMKELKKGAN